MSHLIVKKSNTELLKSSPLVNEQLTCNPQWRVSVSEDNHVWVVRDILGSKQDTQEINFNIKMRDGTYLSDQKNRVFYRMAKQYAEIIRLYMPDISARVHQQ